MLRIARQMALFIARALKLIDAKQHDEALQTLTAAGPEVLGVDLDTLDFGEVGASVDLLGDPARVLAWAQLLEALGTVHAARGEADLARARRERAVLVAHELVRRDAANDDAESLIARVSLHLVPKPPA